MPSACTCSWSSGTHGSPWQRPSYCVGKSASSAPVSLVSSLALASPGPSPRSTIWRWRLGWAKTKSISLGNRTARSMLFFVPTPRRGACLRPTLLHSHEGRNSRWPRTRSPSSGRNWRTKAGTKSYWRPPQRPGPSGSLFIISKA